MIRWLSPSSRFLPRGEDVLGGGKNVEDDVGEILEFHSQRVIVVMLPSDDNEDVTPVIAPEKKNSIMRLHLLLPLIRDKRWSYCDPNGTRYRVVLSSRNTVVGKDYFPSDLQFWSYLFALVKEATTSSLCSYRDKQKDAGLDSYLYDASLCAVSFMRVNSIGGVMVGIFLILLALVVLRQLVMLDCNPIALDFDNLPDPFATLEECRLAPFSAFTVSQLAVCGSAMRARAENERPIVTVAKHRTVTLLRTSVVRSSGELSASVEREFVGDASVGDGGDRVFDSVGGQDNVEPTVPVTEHVETEIPGPKRLKKKRVTHESEKMPAASHPPKRLRADYRTTGGKSLSILNRLLQDSRLMVEHGVPALPTLPFITSSVTASPLEEGGDRTDSVTGPSLRTVGPSARFVVLSDSSHHSGAKSADPEVDSLVRSAAPVMTEATTVATTVAIPADVSKDKSVPHPSVFGSSSSSEKTDRTLSLFTRRSGGGFATRSIHAEEVIGVGLEEIYVPEWTVTKGFELNDGHSCANMIDHFTPPAFFKTVRGMEHEQLFAEFNVSAARNLSLSSEVRMRAEYNILEKRKWKSLAEEKDCLLGARDKEIEELKSQLLKAKEESVEVAQLRAWVSGLEATENSLRGEFKLEVL
ncbi:hypothetical protein Tco_1093475 [Tanacetum coccineum]|uniref:Uncharacterized protein n=1 Tax=Tanacetum coccineum TaxID=301880 RepID=A0ABQ5IF79_9ASTR